MNNYDKLSDRAKQIYGNVEDAMQDAEEMEGVSGVDYLSKRLSRATKICIALGNM
jgi:hypothetical protein